MWYFEYFGYHYSTQKLSCQKLWHLSFQTPYHTCLHEAWMCFCILIKIEDSKNHEYWQVCNFWSRMTIHMTDTSLESSEFTIFEELFWVPFGVPRLAVKSHLYALLIYFWFKNWNELDEFKDSMGTSVVPKKLVLQNLKSKPSNTISHM